MPSLPCRSLLVFTFAAAPVCSQQQPLELAGFLLPELAASAPWGGGIDEPLAALRYGEAVNETTLLFVHTTIDATIAGPDVARGVINLYPFMAPPTSGWTGAQAASIASASFGCQLHLDPAALGAALVVPPARIARHVAQMLGESGAPRYGTASTNGLVNLTQITDWPASLALFDERRVWATATWPTTPAGHAAVFDVVQAGRQALSVAANESVLGSGLSIDAVSLTDLADVCDRELGFQIHVQAVHVDRTSIPPTIRFSQRAVLRRRSLFQNSGDDWFLAYGPRAWVPSVLDHDINIYLAGLGAEMHVLFPQSVANLRAWIPTTTGLVPSDQLPNVDGIHPEIARHAVPENAVPGTVFYEVGGALIAPVGAVNGGALIAPYQPNAYAIPIVL